MKLETQWWKVDTSNPVPTVENPFTGQIGVGQSNSGSNYTIDGLVFQ